MKIWRDGSWRAIGPEEAPFATEAFQYGFGLFETMRLHDRKVLDLEKHLMRANRSLGQLDSDGKDLLDVARIEQEIQEMAARFDDQNGVLKLIVYREAGRLNQMVLAKPFPYSMDIYERGLALKCSKFRRNATSRIVYHKTLNYMENHLERRDARREGYDDALFLNTDGFVSECSAANIFVMSNGSLLTPPISTGLLPGIMRAKLLAAGRELRIAVNESPVPIEALKAADAVFATNALIGVAPVIRIDDILFSADARLVWRINAVLDRDFKKMLTTRQ